MEWGVGGVAKSSVNWVLTTVFMYFYNGNTLFAILGVWFQTGSPINNIVSLTV